MKRLELIEVLKKVMPGVDEKGSLLEGANSFMFDVDWVKTFNEDISVSYPFKSGVKCLVKASEFFKVISKLDSDEVKMIVLDDGKLQLSSAKTTLKMATSDQANFESMVDNLSLDEVKWQPLPDDFIKALRLCTVFAATEQMYQSLCGISVGKDGLVSSDNFRAGWYHIRIKTSEDFIIPIKSAKDLAKIDLLTDFAISKIWLHFKDKNGLCFSSRRLSVEFPRDAVKKFLDFSQVESDKPFHFPDGLVKSVDRASVLSYTTEDGREYVEISLDSKGNMIVSGSTAYGEIKEKIVPDGKWFFPEKVVMKINPRYFGDMVSIDKKFYMRGNRFVMMRNDQFDNIVALTVTKES